VTVLTVSGESFHPLGESFQ